jgi:hypothetical protein
MPEPLLNALRDFADSVKARFTANAAGEPEAQLSGPVSSLLERAGAILGRKIVAKPESKLRDRLGIPDFGILVDGALRGYTELKAPGEGADTSKYKGRNKDQWERFKSQPNIAYTDGNEWCLYQNGKAAGVLLRFKKDITKHGARAVTESDAEQFQDLITRFLAWSPIVPEQPRDQAALLAPLCRLLRHDVADALRDPDSPLVLLAADWRSLLFPEASDDRFADAYAQTVTFALLLARSEGADVSNLSTAIAALEQGHTLLSRALQVLTDAKSRAEIAPSLLLLQSVINAFPAEAMRGKDGEADPWLYFYEHFLSAYDPKLRKDSGAYYTPVAVVKCQVALVDALLRGELGKSGGFANRDVITLDPAVGTGTYLLGVIEHALTRITEEQGPGAVAAAASSLAANLFGFEIMVGPYAVSELRLTRALKDRAATISKDGLGIYLADTLESPHGKPPPLPSYLAPIAEQHKKALQVKDKKSVIVCIGNPPWDRHLALGEDSKDNRARTGGWVRWGDGDTPILDRFVQPAKDAGHGVDVKNLYNLYVYFLRWALWKVFEHTSTAGVHGAGVVSFVTAASYIRGDAFVGVRETLRRLCHQVWIIDVGGEGRGTRQDDNVFDIQTPVAICLALRKGKKDTSIPATVNYASVRGSREEKYEKLGSVSALAHVEWKLCPTEWQAPLRPRGAGEFFAWPKLADMMPWVATGIESKRPWVYAPDEETLRRRWKTLMMSEDRARLLFETRDRKAGDTYGTVKGFDLPARSGKAILDEKNDGTFPGVRMVAHRALGRAMILADSRTCDYARSALWLAHGDAQAYLSTLATQPLGPGPSVIASALVPDRHFFRGSFGGKNTFPLYRDSVATQPNLVPGLLNVWGKKLGRSLKPETFLAYVYALLGHPGFVSRFYDELEDLEIHVPLTLDPTLFDRSVKAGSTLLFLHTYGERYVWTGHHRGVIPTGTARCTTAVSHAPADYPGDFEYVESTGTIRIGDGAFAPVAPAVWGYEVSGLRIVEAWIDYRMKGRKGRKSSDLDYIHPERWTPDSTEEFLRLMWILEHTIAMHADLSNLLNSICAGPLLPAADLPKVTEAMRKPPRQLALYDAIGDDSSDEADE